MHRRRKPPIRVDTAPAARTNVPIYLEGLGTVQAFYTVTITARVDGQLEKVGFVEGQTVAKGALIAQIDPRPYQAALDQAIAMKAKDAAQLQSAKQDLERYTVLAPQDLTSKQTLDAQRGWSRSCRRRSRATRRTSTMPARSSTTPPSPRPSRDAPASVWSIPATTCMPPTPPASWW